MNLSKLYTSYDILSDAKEKISEHFKEYNDAIEATRGTPKEKQLAAQIISKFFKYFPNHQSDAVDAVFDLCEDDDTAIRIAAMKTLPAFCKESSRNISRVADILAQLLQLEDAQEYNIACSTLLQVLKEDAATVIKSVFRLINDKTTDSLVREKCYKFVLTKVKSLDKSVVTAEIEELIFSEVKSSLPVTTADEFVLLMDYLVSSKLSQNMSNQQELVAIISDKVDFESKFVPMDAKGNNADKLITCTKYLFKFFSSKLESTKIVVYYCDEVLSQWEALATLPGSSQYQVAVAQQLAELSQYCGQLENPASQIEKIFEILKIYMPPPPEDTSPNKMPHFNFTMVESLLYAFHRLARQHTDFLTANQELLKDFRSRLMYFSRGVQGCLKVLNLSDKEKIFSAEEKKIRDISPKILNNINTLIKDLFYKTPIYKCVINLSFKTEENSNVKKSSTETVLQGAKRHIPIIYESNGATRQKQGRQNRSGQTGEKKIYTPPSGKFSHNFHNNDRNNRFRGGRGGTARGGSRNRGRGGNYRN